MSKQLSAITNGGISGVHTIAHEDVNCFVQFNDVIPGNPGFDSDQGFLDFRVRPPIQEGHILFYQPSGYDTCTMYCGVTIGGVLTWAPVLIYDKIASRSTGKPL